MTIGWVLFVLYGIGAALFPRFTLATLFFFATDRSLGFALGIWCLVQVVEDFPGARDAVQGFKVVLLVLWELIKIRAARRVRAWCDLLFLMVHGKQFFVVEVVKIEKVVTVEKPAKTRVVRVKEMTIQDAKDCLGCSASPSRQEVEAAYRRTMKQVHPDVGGTNYLARTVVEAHRKLTASLP